MEEARSKLEAAEVSLNRFVQKNDILFLGSPDKAGDREDLVTQQLGVLSDALLKARTDRIAKESLVQQAMSQGVESLPAVLQSPLVAKLKEDLVTREGEYRKLGQTFKPDYPRMQRMEQDIAEVKRQLAVETNRVVEGLDADYRAALRTERQIDKTMAEQQGVVRQLGGKMAEHRLLRRDVDTNRELYTVLLTRLKETQIASALVTSNISVVDRAEVPLSPTSPRKALNLLLGCMIGLLGGVGLAFFFEYLDTNIKDAKEIETLLRVPTIGIVPSQESLEGRRARRDRRIAEESGVGGPFALVAHTEMGSVLAEAFRNLRTSLLYSAPDHPPKTLMVTSLQPEDGKTSLATNLAITLSQLGGEVLLVDGDMRRPNLHQLLDVPQAPGLSTVLTGQAELPAVLKPTSIPNLYLIPAGLKPLNPAELLASTRLRQIVEVLGDRFAHIVFDAPPLIGRQRFPDPGAPAPRRRAGAPTWASRPGRVPARDPASGIGPSPAPRSGAQRRGHQRRVVRATTGTTARRLRIWGYPASPEPDARASRTPRRGSGSPPRSSWADGAGSLRSRTLRLIVLTVTLTGATWLAKVIASPAVADYLARNATTVQHLERASDWDPSRSEPASAPRPTRT